MYVFTARGRIFRTITEVKLDDTMKEDVHRRGDDLLLYLPQLFKQ